MFGFKGSLFLGMSLGIFTMPLYGWLLHEFSILVATLLGCIFTGIIHGYVLFNRSGRPYRKRHSRHRKRRKRVSCQIRIDRYGRIFDPDD
ncbi:MAG: hypothetical protein WBB67_12205 [bacterium]